MQQDILINHSLMHCFTSCLVKRTRSIELLLNSRHQASAENKLARSPAGKTSSADPNVYLSPMPFENVSPHTEGHDEVLGYELIDFMFCKYAGIPNTFHDRTRKANEV